MSKIISMLVVLTFLFNVFYFNSTAYAGGAGDPGDPCDSDSCVAVFVVLMVALGYGLYETIKEDRCLSHSSNMKINEDGKLKFNQKELSKWVTPNGELIAMKW